MSLKDCRTDNTRPFGSTVDVPHVSKTKRMLISGMILLKVRRRDHRLFNLLSHCARVEEPFWRAATRHV
jgi:hypothetical protein